MKNIYVHLKSRIVNILNINFILHNHKTFTIIYIFSILSIKARWYVLRVLVPFCKKNDNSNKNRNILNINFVLHNHLYFYMPFKKARFFIFTNRFFIIIFGTCISFNFKIIIIFQIFHHYLKQIDDIRTFILIYQKNISHFCFEKKTSKSSLCILF